MVLDFPIIIVLWQNFFNLPFIHEVIHKTMSKWKVKQGYNKDKKKHTHKNMGSQAFFWNCPWTIKINTKKYAKYQKTATGYFSWSSGLFVENQSQTKPDDQADFGKIILSKIEVFFLIVTCFEIIWIQKLVL